MLINVAITNATSVTVSLNQITGYEDTAIALNLSTALSDFIQSGNLSDVTLSGIPEDAMLSAGVQSPDGSWTVSATDLVGLTLRPTTDADFAITLSASASASDGTQL